MNYYTALSLLMDSRGAGAGDAGKKKVKPNATVKGKIVKAIRALKLPTGSTSFCFRLIMYALINMLTIQQMVSKFNGSPTAFKNAVKKLLRKGS